MLTMGRFFGHGFGLFFIVFGGIFLAIAMNDGATSWLDRNSTCNYGDCSSGSARSAFYIVGGSFVAVGLLSSVATEIAVRKTRGIARSVSKSVGRGSFNSVEGIADFLAPFGIKVDPSDSANVNVQHRTIDLRDRRTGDVPTDPAGLSSYLKSVGVNIDEDVLRHATVVEGDRVVQQGRATVYSDSSQRGVEWPAPAPGVSSSGNELRRERAVIVRKRDRGETAGEQKLLELEIEVQPAGRVPYRVEIASLVRESLADLLIEGGNLNVRVDPSDDMRVTVDWSEN